MLNQHPVTLRCNFQITKSTAAASECLYFDISTSARSSCPRVTSPVTPYLGGAPVEGHQGQDLRDGAEPVEQHRRELDEQDQREEEHEDEADRLQLQVGDGNPDLWTG